MAEHLALSRSRIRSPISRCFEWFAASGLPQAALYAPPAWARGPIGKDDLERLPFSKYETLAGMYRVGARTFRRMPMTDYLADTAFRALSRRAWNFIDLQAAGTSRPIRVAIHPPATWNSFSPRICGVFSTAADVHFHTVTSILTIGWRTS